MKAETIIKNRFTGISRKLSLSMIIGPIFFTLAWSVMGLLRKGYSPINRPISALGIGPNGAIMDAAFVVTGLLLIIGVTASFQCFKKDMKILSLRICTFLLLLTPIGLLIAGVFTMDNLAIHMLGAQLACGTPIIIFPVVGLILRRLPNWKIFGTWLIIAGLMTLLLLIGFITSVPFSEMATGGGFYGLWQRALLIEIFIWYAAIGLRAARHGSYGTMRENQI